MKTGFGIALLLALLSACSPPPKPYAPAAKSDVEARIAEAEKSTVPADQLIPESPRINTLKVGESCIVTSLGYRIDDSRSLWIKPEGRCAEGRTFLNDIRVIRIAGGYKASLLGKVSGYQNSTADLNLMGFQRVLEIIP